MADCFALRWEATDRGFIAWSGRIMVAMVHRTADDHWRYKMDAVSTRWISKGVGMVASSKAAKAAVRRAWLAWLSEAGILQVEASADA